MESQKRRWRKSERQKQGEIERDGETETEREQQLEGEEFQDSMFLYEKKDKDTEREIKNKYERQKDAEVVIEM